MTREQSALGPEQSALCCVLDAENRGNNVRGSHCVGILIAFTSDFTRQTPLIALYWTPALARVTASPWVPIETTPSRETPCRLPQYHRKRRPQTTPCSPPAREDQLWGRILVQLRIGLGFHGDFEEIGRGQQGKGHGPLRIHQGGRCRVAHGDRSI